MSTTRWLASVIALACAGLMSTATPVSAGTSSSSGPDDYGFGTPTESISAYGDFAEIGNGSLRCPVAGEPALLLAGPQSCQRASERDPLYALPLFGWGSNNGYDMQLAGAGQTNGPGGATLFDESSASVTIPAGTSVLYAQLDWGGDTGSYLGASDDRCERPPYLFEPAATPPPAPAAASPDAQPVTIAVGSDPAAQVAVDPSHYTSSQSSSSPVGMYSDWADVTTDFADLLPGAASTVSVGDVWAPTGYGCAAGWSLTLVFGATTAIPGYSQLRQFDVYAGHLRTTGRSDLSLSLAEPNIDPAAADVKLGVTAYDGDWNNAGDSLLVDGTAVADPCASQNSDSTNNFFTSCADGAVDPLDPGQPIPNNFSVDAKTVTPTVTKGTAAPGDIDIELRTRYDVTLVQGFVVAENIDPSFTANSPPTFNKKNLRVGDTVQFTITGTNTGDIPLSDLTLADTLHADCQPASVATLAPGATYTFTCALPIPDVTSLSDTITVTASWPGDSAGLTANAQVGFTEPVLGPQLGISQTASTQAVQSGQPVTVTITATNNGDSDDGALTNVTITEPGLPGCTVAAIPNLPPGTSQQLYCTTRPTTTVTATAHAAATDDTGVTLTATSNPVTVTISAANLVITNYANPSQVAPGGTTRFTVTVHNTGSVAVTLRVSDDNVPGCDFTVDGAGLAAGAAHSEECAVTVPRTTGTFTDTATFVANPLMPDGTTGPTIAGSAKGSVLITASAAAVGGGSSSGSPSGSGAVAAVPLSGSQTAGASSAPGAAGPGGAKAAGGGSGSLAYTGVELAVPVAVAALLLVGGLALVLFTRRRTSGRP
jgi:uncharacterized repeat protein (TIGR01451 family)